MFSCYKHIRLASFIMIRNALAATLYIGNISIHLRLHLLLQYLHASISLTHRGKRFTFDRGRCKRVIHAALGCNNETRNMGKVGTFGIGHACVGNVGISTLNAQPNP